MSDNLIVQRDRIDEIDQEMVKLFLERMQCAKNIGDYKREHNLPVLDPSRERNVIANLTKDKQEPIGEYIKMLYMTMFDISKSYQEQKSIEESALEKSIVETIKNTPPLFPKQATVACQGVEGANSTQACDTLFSRSNITYLSNFEGVFKAVSNGFCEYGVLPVENNLHGSVTEVYDLMRKYEFQIVRSVKIKINHTLLVKPGTKLSDIKEIVSHPQALAQCSNFLIDSGVKITECSNTAVAAQLVSNSEDNSIAAIASKNCSKLYGLEVIKEDVQNNENNYTRFICISKVAQIFEGANKISLMFTVPHKPGSLYTLISKFSSLGINMSKLESRPIPGKAFEFMFYIDFDGDIKDPITRKLMSQLENSADKFIYLGSYREL